MGGAGGKQVAQRAEEADRVITVQAVIQGHACGGGATQKSAFLTAAAAN